MDLDKIAQAFAAGFTVGRAMAMDAARDSEEGPRGGRHKESDTTERLNTHTHTGKHSWNTFTAKWTFLQQLKTHYFRIEHLKQYSKVITAQAEASSAGL